MLADRVRQTVLTKAVVNNQEMYVISYVDLNTYEFLLATTPSLVSPIYNYIQVPFIITLLEYLNDMWICAYVNVYDGTMGIASSTDLSNWTTTPTGEEYLKPIKFKNTFISLVNYNEYRYSIDLLNWQNLNLPLGYSNIQKLVPSGDKLIAYVRDDDFYISCLTSTDLISWQITSQIPFLINDLLSVVYYNDIWLVGTSNNGILISTDCITWSQGSSSRYDNMFVFNDILISINSFSADNVQYMTALLYSTDGYTFTSRTTYSGRMYAMYFADTMVIASLEDNDIPGHFWYITSIDGINWDYNSDFDSTKLLTDICHKKGDE